MICLHRFLFFNYAMMKAAEAEIPEHDAMLRLVHPTLLLLQQLQYQQKQHQQQ